MYHWQAKINKPCGVEDMVLLPKVDEANIVENLRKRLMEDLIYSYIGPVLVAVNPFKALPYFSDKEVDQYQGAVIYENPPHVFALCDNMYRNMIIDNESQCVIISGESGAGKTVSAKYIMQYLSKISGGGSSVQHIKDIILESNPLLEAFGNAKTIRNDNSSRFGKYVEIQFAGGCPQGGRISNFLLEKSRVVMQNQGERNFHIFYQAIEGSSTMEQEELGLGEIDYFSYLTQSGCTSIKGTSDRDEYKATRHAMSVVEIPENIQKDIIKLVAAVLHIGNITFTEDKNYAVPVNDQFMEFPAYLLSVSSSSLKTKLISRIMESKWGKQSEKIIMQLNKEQANFTRDALAKAIYCRLFDYLVESINRAMEKQNVDLCVGILDIYGFEIFQKNGFEQFCINYVNEKLQQIFIELTLKAEQDEYMQEGIKWDQIKFFNNKIVCDLVESKKPPGIICVLDDICATMHAQGDGSDQSLLEKLSAAVGSHEHYTGFNQGFSINHYAGRVTYEAGGFCERNRDVLFVDLIELMKSSSMTFLKSLFPEDISDRRGKPTTVGTKIRSQANDLIDKLMQCVPHYIRCIKPNETKKPKDWDGDRVRHQVEYLGLKENIRVRRAGYAFRRPFEKFLKRYSILSPETYPEWRGDPRAGIKIIMNVVNMDSDQWQLGKTKIFIKSPEALFLLEEVRERRYDVLARRIQETYRRYRAVQVFSSMKDQACELLLNKKQRRRGSINRDFYGDYINLDDFPALRNLLDKKEHVEFAESVMKYDRRFKSARRDLILTKRNIYLIGLEKIQKGPDKGKIVSVLKRKIPITSVSALCMSTLQDSFVLLEVTDDYTTVFTSMFKTEFITLLSKAYKEATLQQLPLRFSNNLTFQVKKEGWGGGKTCSIEFKENPAISGPPSCMVCSGKLVVVVAPGLPSNTRPSRSLKSQTGPSQSLYQTSTKTVLPSQSSLAQGRGTGGNRTTTAMAPRKAHQTQMKPVGQLCRSLWAYDANDADELSFPVGAEIEIVQKDPSGWWTGRYNSRKGLFPGNYVQEL